MAMTRRRRAALVGAIMLASLLLFGCDFLDGLLGGVGSRAAEEDREAGQQAIDDLFQPQETAPSDQEEGALTEAQDGPATGPITAQEIAGTYSAGAVLQRAEAGVESADSLPVTVQLNENGTGTATVDGYSGAAEFSGTSVSFSVTMEESGHSIVCNYEGVAARGEDDGRMAISGTMSCSMMGVTFAWYDWTAYK